MARLTNAFSKKWKNLEDAYLLWFAYYNWCRIHKTLRVTPAMEATLIDHVWQISELLQKGARNTIQAQEKPACQRVTCVDDVSRRATLKGSVHLMLAQLQIIDFPPREGDDSMAVSEKDFRELAVKVEGIQGERRVWKFLPTAAIAVGLGAMGWCWHINDRINTVEQKITAIEQELADGGNAKLVAELRAPKSTEQLQANLATITAQIQTARVNGEQPDAKKVEALSKALAQVVQKNPQLPEAWQVAGELISYRAIPAKPASTLAECSPVVFTGMPQQDWRIPVLLQLQNCTIALDDLAQLSPKLMGLLARDQGQVYKSALLLRNVHVVYRGGAIALPVRALIFNNCTFEFDLDGSPPAPGNSLTETLLVATDIRDVSFTFPA